jgi:hypothetical protein
LSALRAPPAARAMGRSSWPADEVIHIGALSHFDLLDHPTVYAHIREVVRRRYGRSRPTQGVRPSPQFYGRLDRFAADRVEPTACQYPMFGP